MLFVMAGIINSKRNCLTFALLATTFNTIFKNYVIFCCSMQFLAFIWCLYLVIRDHSNFRYQAISASLCLFFLLLYSLKGLLANSWSYFLKVFCIFSFIQNMDDNDERSIIANYAKVTMYCSFTVLALTIMANILRNDITSLPAFFNPLLKSLSDSIYVSQTERYCGFLGNSNLTAMFFCVSLISSIYLLKCRHYSFFSFALILISSYIIIITQSRGSILTAAVFIISLPIFFSFLSYSSCNLRTKKIIRIAVIIIAVLLICIAAFLLFNSQAFALMSQVFRFQIPEESTLSNKISAIFSSLSHGSGRNHLIDAQYEVFRRSPFTGAAYSELIEPTGGHLVHNGFLVILFLLGIPAFIGMMILLMVMSIIPAFKCMIHRRQYSGEERFQISFSIAALMACIFYNFFENAIGPLGNDPFSMLFLLSSGVLFRISHKAV